MGPYQFRLMWVPAPDQARTGVAGTIAMAMKKPVAARAKTEAKARFSERLKANIWINSLNFSAFTGQSGGHQRVCNARAKLEKPQISANPL